MFNFDMDQVEATSSVIPAGKYLAQVEKVELKDSKNGGQYISAQFTITDENQNGRKFFEMYNVFNQSEKTVQIALGQIKSLILASGANLTKFTSPEQLIGLECLVSLKVQSDEYGDKNKITSYSKPQISHGESAELPKGPDGKPIF